MVKRSKHWGVIGGGMLGMQLANKLVKEGHQVNILEAAEEIGGLTSVWQIDNATWDKYYHVILLSDLVLRELLEELGLDQEMKWVETKSGFYTDGKLYSMSNSLEFLQFPPLSLIDKFRLGLTIFYASKVKNWKRLERIPVADWLKKWSGENTFNKIWLPLLRAKLGENYRHTSAAFIWATIQRMYAARRTGLKKEMFGYVNGGYATILKTFKQHLLDQGVSINTGFRTTKVKSDQQGKVQVLDEKGDSHIFDEVILSVPSSIASTICQGLSESEKGQHQQIEYLGVVCASVLLKKSISPYYVTNVTDTTPFTGVIEMTNMVDPSFFNGHSLVYLPKYVKKSDPFFQWSDEKVKAHFSEELVRMYDHINADDLVEIKVARAANVFALSTLQYSDYLPPVTTNIPGVHILNSSHISNGTLNVNETLQLVDKKLPQILLEANKSKQPIHVYE